MDDDRSTDSDEEGERTMLINPQGKLTRAGIIKLTRAGFEPMTFGSMYQRSI